MMKGGEVTKKLITGLFLVTCFSLVTLTVAAKTWAKDSNVSIDGQATIKAIPSNTELVKISFDETGTIR